MANIGWVFGVLNQNGINTKGLTVEEAFEELEALREQERKDFAQSEVAKVEENKKDDAEKDFFEEEKKSKSFINMQLFASDYSRRKTSEISKSKKSLKSRIEEHNIKVAYPEKSYEDWEENKVAQKGRLKHWKNELRDFKEEIIAIDKELKKRGEKNE